MSGKTTGILETLRDLDDYEFEHFIADVWQECQGWSTKVAQQSRDRGIDVVGEPPGWQSTKTAVQAKCYAAGNKVGAPKIREYDTIRREFSDIDSVTVVTTSSFTTDALDTADRLGVNYIDGNDLVRIIQRDGALEIVEWYAAGRPEDW